MDAKQVNALLIILLLCAVGYIGYGKYTAYKSSQQEALMLQGAQIGAQQAIIAIAQQVAQCNQVPLIIGNQTINIVAIDCLQAAAQR
jgi:hypothetical protein